eukprot:1179749-Prorocentrum_minimum.AAC.1
MNDTWLAFYCAGRLSNWTSHKLRNLVLPTWCCPTRLSHFVCPGAARVRTQQCVPLAHYEVPSLRGVTSTRASSFILLRGGDGLAGNASAHLARPQLVQCRAHTWRIPQPPRRISETIISITLTHARAS